MAIGGTAVGLAGFWVEREELGLVLPLLNLNDVYMSYLLICLKKLKRLASGGRSITLWCTCPDAELWAGSLFGA